MQLPFFKKKPEEEPDDKKTVKTRTKKPPANQPWTKKERLIVLYVLLGTIISSSLLALVARNFKLPGLPRLTLPTIPGLPDYFEETFVFEKNPAYPQFESIINDFESKTEPLSGVYGFFVNDLDDNNSYGLYEDEVFPAASLIKLPVMIALYQQKPEGYKDLVYKMGKRSDNKAFTDARNLLGDRVIQETIFDLGLTKTSLAENETTPREVADLFYLLHHNQVLPAQDSQEILDSLTNTIYEEHLAAGIPDEFKVAHKYGREVHVVADGGIIYTNQPFIMIIMSKGAVESQADANFPELSNLLFAFESKN